MPFLDNKYTKIYFRLMSTRKTQSTESPVYDRHHILPRSLGGSNNSSNLVLLTPREHYVAHRLLTKMCRVGSLENRSMHCAMVRFLGKNKQRYKNRITSRAHQTIIEGNRMAMSGKGNPFYGKTHSDETRKNMSTRMKAASVGPANKFYGRKHTLKTKKRISQKNSRIFWVEWLDGRREEFPNMKNMSEQTHISLSMIGKLRYGSHNHLLKKYGIKSIQGYSGKSRKTTYSLELYSGNVIEGTRDQLSELLGCGYGTVCRITNQKKIDTKQRRDYNILNVKEVKNDC